MRVKKSDGREEEFIREKITVALVKNGLDIEAAREIANAVENKFSSRDALTSREIRDEVLQRVKERDASLYQKWLDFEKTKD
ncbi:MAG: ATP cone domain-containing protein [Candidatus Marsarchaeota archaeon]|jgi:transcriptional regulator NrdR family protein|nr:ATP cone domain-containing protein [Candidatus Marsarchaeota archaeon]MCL5418413.1 ATP cone domain-containing protein [Candidatus Marsarchaeota archaeon]